MNLLLLNLHYLHSLCHETIFTLNTSETVPVDGALYTTFSTAVRVMIMTIDTKLFGAGIAGFFLATFQSTVNLCTTKLANATHGYY